MPLRLVVTNGSKRWARRSSGMPLAVVGDGDHRAADGPGCRCPARQAARHAVGGRQQRSRRRCVRRRLGGILHEVEEDLDQQIVIAEHRRQRRIVVLDEPMMAGEAGLRHLAHALEHLVDVDRRALDRRARRRTPPCGRATRRCDRPRRRSGASARGRPAAFCSRSCAAPRMPESGFLTSWASIAAIAVTERAALRCVSCRSILWAIERSCSVTTSWPGCSTSAATWIVMTCGRAAASRSARHTRRSSCRCAAPRRSG